MSSTPSGQSITEYGLIGASIAVISLVALSQLGGVLSNGFEGMLSGSSTAASASSTETQNADPTSSDPAGTIEGWTGNVSLSAFPTDLKSFVQTAGANGTTNLFATQIRTIGEQLLAKGEITQEQANDFFELANQGNRISTIEKLVEEAMINGTQTFTFEGKTYTPFELTRLIGWPDEPTDYYSMGLDTTQDLMNRSPDARSETMENFLSIYQKLEQSGALKNPAIQQTISDLTVKIGYLSEVVESNVSDQHWGKSTTPLDSYVISQTSFWSSSEICSAGDGNTVGVTCQ